MMRLECEMFVRLVIRLACFYEKANLEGRQEAI